ncbi:MAG: tetratricopeptide repeat protein [Acidobacteriota bacterium]
MKLLKLAAWLLVLCFTAWGNSAWAQEGFKGERAPNPTVNRSASAGAKTRTAKGRRGTTKAPKASVADQIEDAIERGNIARDEDKLAEAEKQYRHAISLNAGEWRAWYGLGNVYNDGGNYDQAIDALTEALRLNSASAEAHHSLGTSYYLKERFTESIQQYSEAVRLKSDYAYAYYDLGMAYVRVKNTKAALEQYEILKRLNPGLAANLRSYIR